MGLSYLSYQLLPTRMCVSRKLEAGAELGLRPFNMRVVFTTSDAHLAGSQDFCLLYAVRFLPSGLRSRALYAQGHNVHLEGTEEQKLGSDMWLGNRAYSCVCTVSTTVFTCLAEEMQIEVMGAPQGLLQATS